MLNLYYFKPPCCQKIEEEEKKSTPPTFAKAQKKKKKKAGMDVQIFRTEREGARAVESGSGRARRGLGILSVSWQRRAVDGKGANPLSQRPGAHAREKSVWGGERGRECVSLERAKRL